MKKFSSKKKLVGQVMLITLLVLMLSTGIFAWIYGDVAPGVTGNMQIGDYNGLIFNIEDSEAQLIDLNANLGLSSTNMILNEVSTVDGINFFKRDLSRFYEESGNPELNNEVITFSSSGARKNEMVSDGQGGLTLSGDFVEVQMNLSLDNTDTNAKYYIYFLEGSLNAATGYDSGFFAGSESGITEDGLKALRAYIKIDGADTYGPALDNATHSAFFGNAAETAADGYTQAVQAAETVNLRPDVLVDKTDSVLMAGSYYLDYLYPGENPAQLHSFGTIQNGTDVYSFDAYSIDGADGLTGTAPPGENYLVALDSTCKSVNITLRLWLEGGSRYCENAYISAADNVQFNMYLVSYKVNEDGAATPTATP